ncbi:MAG: TonB-dependent receptor plug domain-containing protein [Bacteroidetes bacterium]|nr:TonB-dependent receptor plug domain-containing protein [Bacteroidota bacterium]
MKSFKLNYLFLLALLFLTICISAQNTIKGVVLDRSTNQPIPMVEVTETGTMNSVISGANGTFQLNILSLKGSLSFSHVSFEDKQIPIPINPFSDGNIVSVYMEPKVIGLNEVHVISSFVSEEHSIVAVSTISSKTIEHESGNQDYPEILKLTPGIYATKAGGGSGDDQLSIRGFQQENVALLLNGVPVSSMENGLVYWSNWMGLTDATEAIQVQRGLGASKVAMNSVGGTVNIITKSTQSEKGGSIRYSLSDYGNQKAILQLSTGRMKNGSAITFLGSRSSGPGYVEGTYVNGWSYFLSVSKEINPRQTLVFTALGSPEHHGQRNYGLTYDQYLRYGSRYNPSWGIYKGRVFNLSENFYHKPQLNLNHYWNISPKLFLATSAYVSFGSGGGRYSESSDPGYSAWTFTKNNQIDFDAIFKFNQDNIDSLSLENGTTVKDYSRIILTNYKATHYWAGLLSTLTYTVSPKLKLIAGVHFRKFKSRLYEEVADLMGGDYWVEHYYYSIRGVSGRSQIKRVGDVINVDNYSMMNYGNLFGQLEYKNELISLFLTSTISATEYQRKDPFNYVENALSEKVNKLGFDVKSGFGYKIGSHGQAYINVGYYSREPYFKFIYVNYSNAVARNLRNEKISALELGYELKRGNVNARINGYYTYWKDKSLLSWENIQLPNSSYTRSLVRGLNAIHKGLEIELNALLLKDLSLTATGSFGDWKWQNDVMASIYDDNQVLIDSTKIYTKGLFVGGAPQTQLGFSVSYTFLDHFDFVVNLVYYDRLYANFEPSNRTSSVSRVQPYSIPSYAITDTYLNYNFEIGKYPAEFQLSCQNLFNKVAIIRGEDGPDHSLNSFTGFWAQGRTFNVSMKVSF